MARHYVAMSGSCGCLPDYCMAYTRLAEAVEALDDLHGLAGMRIKGKLRRTRYVSLPRGQYAGVLECDCADPSVHCD